MKTTAPKPFHTCTVTPSEENVTLRVPPSLVGKKYTVSFTPVDPNFKDPFGPSPEFLRQIAAGKKVSELLWGCIPREAAEDFRRHIKESREW